MGEGDADLVAAAVGDLPLALAQAAGYMAPAGVPASDYVRLVEERAVEILDEGRPASYPLSLAAVTQLALDRLEAADPAAAQAVRIRVTSTRFLTDVRYDADRILDIAVHELLHPPWPSGHPVKDRLDVLTPGPSRLLTSLVIDSNV
jgi:hypothetical protein